MNKSVVVTHFYNESLLLPYWLDHHTRLFDEGVLIDYNSTDDSVEICKTLAPQWRLVTSRNEMFGAKDCDNEVMDYEAEYDGYWKVALNTTEFLVMSSFNEYTEAVEQHHEGVVGFRAHGIHMMDPPHFASTPLMRRQPLVLQRHWGFDLPGTGRDRIIHKAPNGDYDTGRHNTFLKNILGYGNEVYVLWFGWSPWPQVKNRKLQIKTKIPQEDKDLGLGMEHLIPPDDMDEYFEKFSPTSRDLMQDPDYSNTWQLMMKNLYNWPLFAS